MAPAAKPKKGSSVSAKTLAPTKSKKKGKAKKGNGPKDKPTKKYVGQGK